MGFTKYEATKKNGRKMYYAIHDKDHVYIKPIITIPFFSLDELAEYLTTVVFMQKEYQQKLISKDKWADYLDMINEGLA